MKATAIAVFLILSGCASVAPYVHDKNTHARAVDYQLQRLQPVIRSGHCGGNVRLSFSVKETGDLHGVSVYGGCSKTRQRTILILEGAAPFPPHNHGQPITYKTVVRY